MQFVYPGFLWALAILAVPIIIHLFYFRRYKKVNFTNVRFLKEVKDETSTRNKLKHLLVLLSRLLAIGFLVLAFVQPFIPVDDNMEKGSKAVSIFIDNSFSMNALSQDVPLLDLAKKRASEIISGYNQEDQFQVLTHSFQGKNQRLLNKDDALARVDEVAITPKVNTLERVINRQQQLLVDHPERSGIIYVISDFQQSITSIGNQIDSTITYNFIPIQSVQENNVSIDSCWFAGPVHMVNENNPLFIKMTNYGSQAAENIRLSMYKNGQEQPLGSVNIAAGTSVIDTVNITPFDAGWKETQIKITDYPITFDDTYYLTYQVKDEINVLIINDRVANPYLQAAFSGIQYFKTTNTNTNNIQYASFPSYQLIILNETINLSSGLISELKEYAGEGGNLLIFPGKDSNIEQYNDLLQSLGANTYEPYQERERQIADINTDEFVFNNVFERTRPNLRLPKTLGNFPLTRFPSKGEEYILRYRDGQTFVGKYLFGKGYVYVSSAPVNIEISDLTKNAEVFVPMLYKMSIASSESNKIAYTIGANEVLQLENKANAADLVYKMVSSEQEWIPRQTAVGNKIYISFDDQIENAGYAKVMWNNEEEGVYGFNFDRTESDLSMLSRSDLNDQFGDRINIINDQAIADFSKYIQEKNSGRTLWRWCLLLALSFLLIEVLILRFWKT